MAKDKRQAWDPEAPKLKRATGPTWHRVGWHQREFHSTAARVQKEHEYQQQEQQQKKQLLQKQQEQCCPFSQLRLRKQQLVAQQQQQAARRPVVAHTHSTTYMHSFKQGYTHKTTLIKQWVPGAEGAPAAVMNIEGLCDELNTRLLHVDSTLMALLSRTQQPQQQLTDEGIVAARQKLEKSLEHQLAFSNALLLDWCGAVPAGSCEQVLQKLLVA